MQLARQTQSLDLGAAPLMRRGRLLLSATALALTSLGALAGPSVFPTGTTRYDPARADNGYVLFTGGDNVARLIDLNGNTVRTWKDAGGHSTAIDPAVNGGRRGHVLVTLTQAEGPGSDLIPGRVNTRVTKTIGELDWNGQTVWQFGDKAPGGFARQHHDWARLPNGNTVVLANLTHAVSGFKLPALFDDVIYEGAGGVGTSARLIGSGIAAGSIQSAPHRCPSG